MSSLMDKLADTLEEQAEYYEQILALSEEKKDVIVRNDVEALQKITNIENIILSKNAKADKSREQSMADLAEVYGFKNGEFNTEKLLSVIKEQPERHKLEAAVMRIKESAGKLGEINAQNKQLIDSSLDYIGFTMNLLRGAMQNEPTFYSAKGDEIGESQGLFDIKQ